MKTQRLSLSPLTQSNSGFILELVNTPGWLQFIGDRHVKSVGDAQLYVQKIMENPDVTYWIVSLNQSPIGIITFIKRHYLEHHDIGFAFLPDYSGQGYALEATKAVLNHLFIDGEHSQILATTFRENTSSINLLKKLGFTFDRIIENDGTELMLYALHS